MNQKLATVVFALLFLTCCSSTWESPFMDGEPSPPDTVDEEPSPGPATTYTIERGDSLWSIAKKTYGHGKYYERIVEANPGLDPRRMQVGQEIILPASVE